MQLPSGPPLLPEPGAPGARLAPGVPLAPGAGGPMVASAVTEVVLRRSVVPLLVEALIPLLLIGIVPLGFLVADRERFESGRLPLEMGVAFVVGAALSLVWVGRECVRLTPTGITIVRRVGSTSLPWWQVRGIEVRQHFGQRFVHLAGPEGDAQVFAPNSGVPLFRDRQFEAKVATIEQWWVACRTGSSPLG